MDVGDRGISLTSIGLSWDPGGGLALFFRSDGAMWKLSDLSSSYDSRLEDVRSWMGTVFWGEEFRDPLDGGNGMFSGGVGALVMDSSSL